MLFVKEEWKHIEDITYEAKVRAVPKAEGNKLHLLFDSGSPFTFVRRDKAIELGLTRYLFFDIVVPQEKQDLQ